MAITVTDVVSEYGAYYLNHGQNIQNLTKKLYQPSVTASYFAPRPTENTVLRFSNASLDRVIQPFQKAFTAIGDLTFKPTPIPLFKIKIDKEEYPDDIAETWLGFLEGEGVDRADWPFIRWFIEEHIIPRAQEDMELNEIFAGEYASPVPNSAGASGTAMDGILKIQNDWIAANRITPISTIDGTDTQKTPEEWCTSVEQFVENIDEIYRRRIDHVFMSEALELKYRKGKRAKYNENYAQEPNLGSIANFPNITVVGLPSHTGSKRIWSSLPEVRIRGLKKNNLRDTLKVESAKRNVALFTDWYEGVGFSVPEFVFVNDKEASVSGGGDEGGDEGGGEG